MTKSELYYLAARCIALDEKPKYKHEIIEAFTNDLFDWHGFVSMCSENLVLPLIFIKLKKHGILEFIPEEVGQHLLEIYKLNSKRNAEILDQIKYITNILNENNIFPIYLKGAGNLLDNFYADIGERMMGDIDFLVAEDDYLKSAELMIKNGFYPEIDVRGLDVMHFDHYPRLRHPVYPADLEIHRIPTDYDCSGWYGKEIVDAEKQTAPELGGCFVQSPRHRVMLNFIHSQLSHEGYLYGWVSLKDIYDLSLLSNRVPLTEILPLIKEKGKAIAYFSFAKNALGADNLFFAKQNLQYSILKKKHDLNLDSTLFHSCLLQYERWRKAFLYTLQKGIFSKEIRQIVIRKFKVG
jgi:hypothetical protein